MKRSPFIQHDAPMLADFTASRLCAVTGINKQNGVKCFDQRRATSLLLFEHVHAESAIAGQSDGRFVVNMKPWPAPQLPRTADHLPPGST